MGTKEVRGERKKGNVDVPTRFPRHVGNVRCVQSDELGLEIGVLY